MTTPTTTAAQPGSGLDIAQVLSDLDSTITAVQNNDWVSAGLDGAASALDVLGGGSDPLSALAGAGFGFVSDLVSFLAAPLKTLTGDGSSVSSGADGLQGAGQHVSSVADDYQQAAGTQTSGWSGAAASGYQNTAGQLAGQLRAIGKASAAVSSAMAGAGKVVDQARQIVTQLVGEASGAINEIMTQAIAAAQATGGASIAAAIPQCVQVAVRYGEQIAEKMGALFSSSQNLTTILLGVVKSLEAVDAAVTQTTGHGAQTTATGTSPNSLRSGGQYQVTTGET